MPPGSGFVTRFSVEPVYPLEGPPAPLVVDSIELVLGPQTWKEGRRLAVSVSQDGAAWSPARVLDGRPPVSQRVGGEHGPSQVLVLEAPTRARALRITQSGRSKRRWRIAELYVTAAVQ